MVGATPTVNDTSRGRDGDTLTIREESMRRTWLSIAGALLLAGCGSQDARDDATASYEQAQMAGGGGMGGGGMGGGGMMMDENCMGMMGGGGMVGGGGGMGGGSQLAMLGRMIFCDKNLSNPVGQSCASCHAPSTGFTGPLASVNAAGAVYQGALTGRFGDRKPPSAAYATPSPVLYYDSEEGLFVGGLFWDGRATGWRLGSPAAEQALGPFLNPAEQNLATAAAVVSKVCSAMYGQMFRMVFGASACTPSNVAADYDNIGFAIAAFEDSPMVNRYSSKYDRYLRGEATLTSLERKGLALFEGKANCALCHPSQPGEGGEPPIFTDNTFDNLGLPRNPQNPVYEARGDDWVDQGLGGFLEFARRRPGGEGRRERRQAPRPDAAQRRQAAVRVVREGVRAQRRVQEPEADRALLQHARRAPALRDGAKPEGRPDLLAGARGRGEPEHRGAREPTPHRARRGRHRRVPEDAFRRLRRRSAPEGAGGDGAGATRPRAVALPVASRARLSRGASAAALRAPRVTQPGFTL